MDTRGKMNCFGVVLCAMLWQSSGSTVRAEPPVQGSPDAQAVSAEPASAASERDPQAGSQGDGSLTPTPADEASPVGRAALDESGPGDLPDRAQASNDQGDPTAPSVSEPSAAPASSPAPAASAVSHQAFDPERPPNFSGRNAYDRPRRKSGMFIGGFITFVSSYIFTVAVGQNLRSGEGLEPGEECTNCDKGGLLRFPLVGPWLLFPHADGADGKAASAFMGVSQGVGFAVLLGGIGRLVADAPGYALHVAPARGGLVGQVAFRL